MRRTLAALALGVLLFAFAVRVWQGASRGGVWRDEANAFFVVQESASLGELFRNLRVESTPPLEPVLEYLVQRTLGPDVKWLRGLAVLFGTATVGGIVLLGWRSFHPACGLLAGVLAATSPYFIRISGEMRSYPIFGMLAAVHALLYLRHLERRRTRDACLWGASAAALAYAHYYAFPIVFCAGVASLVVRRARADLLRLGAAAAVFLVLYAPWLPMLVHHLGADLQPWYPPLTDLSGTYLILKLPLGYTGAFLLAASLLLGAYVLRPGTPDAEGAPPPERLRFWALLALSVAPAALVGAMQVYVGAFEGRYLIGMAVPLLPPAGLFWSRMFLGEASSSLPWRWARAAGALQRHLAWALLAGALLVQHLDRARWLRPSSPAREFAALVSRNARPDDLIWIFPAPYASSFNFYFGGAQPQLAFPFRGRVTKIDWVALRDDEQDPAIIDAFLGELERQLRLGGRVWALFVESLPMDAAWAFQEGPSPPMASRLARAEFHVHRRALRMLYGEGRVAGWWDRPHRDYHEGMTLVLFAPKG